MTARDGRQEYTYEGAWYRTKHGVNWHARVHRHGELAGEPNGLILHSAGSDFDRLVREYVEKSIEHRVDVA